MKKRKNYIYVPQVDKIYNSIAEAAKDLKVDAGNISKVLKGKRKSAGGFSFLSATGKGGGKKRKSTLQKLAAELLPADPLERKRQQLKEVITAANKQLKRLREAGLSEFSAAAKNIMAFADDLGTSAAGYLATSGKRFQNLNEAQIDKFIEAITSKQKQRSYTVEGATAEAERLANNFGTTAQRIIDLSDALPLFFNVLKNLAKDETSDDVLDEIDAFDDPDATAEDLFEQLLNISNDRAIISAIAETLDGDDTFMLEKYAPIREDLQALSEAAAADPRKYKNTINEVRNYIQNSIYYDDVSDVNDMISDTIRTALGG